MAKLLSLLIVCVFSQGILATIDFDCRTLVPRGRIESDKQTDSPFKITTSGTQYSPGNYLNVTLAASGRSRISHFVLQARHPLDDVPLGSWEVYSSDQKTHSCADEADTVVSGVSAFREVEQVKAKWIPPQEAGNGQVEFVATVKNYDGLFWTDIISVLVKEMTSFTLPHEVHRPHQPDSQAPSEDHGLTLESELKAQMEEKRQKMLDDEDANSEGDWTKDIEKQRQEDEEEHRKEEMEYEIGAQKEEEERMARIRMEILDKEAFDREEAERQREDEERLREEREREREKNESEREEREREMERERENEIEIDDKIEDGTAGSSTVAPILATMLAMLFACLL